MGEAKGAKQERHTETSLFALVAQRFAPPAFACLRGVRNATGARGVERYADAIAMSLWPSRGLEVYGFEIKCARSDWVRELNDPAKSVPIQRFCDRWWVVAPDGVVKAGELPPMWGHFVPRGQKLDVLVDAPKLESTPLDRVFVASLFRAAQEQLSDHAVISQRVADEVNRCVQEAEARQAERTKCATDKLQRVNDELNAKILRFREKTGINPFEEEKWSRFPSIGDTVNFVRRNILDPRFSEVRDLAHRVAAAAEEMRRAVAQVESLRVLVQQDENMLLGK